MPIQLLTQTRSMKLHTFQINHALTFTRSQRQSSAAPGR